MSVALQASGGKPSYRVPSMEDIAIIPWNRLTVCSLFAGTGGFCLGYRMAGYRVIWANEFVPIAQACYRANFGDTVLDGRDIREVQARDILAATGLAEGELDLLDGSPPCQAFSTAGKRHKGWGQEKRYEHGAHQRNETLFTEYVRLLHGLMPRVFVAENVSGLVKGVAKGFFKEILRDLKVSGYRVEARLLDAQWLGVPQVRQRIIFQGVREDLDRDPVWPRPLSYRYSVREALPWLTDVMNPAHGFTKENDLQLEHPAPVVPASGGTAYTGHQVTARVIHDTGGFIRDKDVTDVPCPAITNGVNALNSFHYQVRWDEGGTWNKRDVTNIPAPTVRSGRAGTLVIEGANRFNNHAGSSVEGPMPTVQAGRSVHVWRDDRGMHGHGGDITDEPSPARMAGSIGTHWIIEQDVPQGLHPSGINVHHPHDTIAASSGRRTSSSWAHVPCAHPTERRKFTIAELKRICAFPDDFVLVGSYAQQWERLGNAVPPVMMAHLAAAIRDGVLLQP